MEPIYDNRDKEERQRRAERIERMRREKELQRKRRLLIKKFLPVGVFAIVIVTILIVAGVALSKKPKEETSGNQNTSVENIGSNGENQKQEEQSAVNGPAQQSGLMIGATNATPMPTEAPTVAPTVEPASPQYSFTTADNAVTIYSEEVISTHALLVDVSKDEIVASKGAFDRISPASMTKVLTILVAAEHITEEQLDDTFTMTLEITDYAYVNDCSTVGFLNQEVVPVRDLFYGTVLPSGADAAVGLAYYVAGSQEAFVELMNEKLEELGLSETAHFTNCVGLYDKEHYCTLYDMAIIMRAAMENELCREFLSKHSYTTQPTTQHPEGIVISNWFLRRIEDKETGGEVIGAKTGFVVQSQNCAVSYGTFADGTPYICVTAGSTSSWRCIYDQVEIFNRYIPAATPQ